MDQVKLVEKAAFKKIEMTWSATAVFQILPGIYAWIPWPKCYVFSLPRTENSIFTINCN